jgi:hypothetical protein
MLKPRILAKNHDRNLGFFWSFIAEFVEKSGILHASLGQIPENPWLKIKAGSTQLFFFQVRASGLCSDESSLV